MRTPWVVAALAVMLVGCGARAEGERAPSARQQQGVITPEEVRTGPQSNAYDLVLALRPQWLRERGPTSLGGAANTQVRLYVDEVRVGNAADLRRIPVPTIASLRFLDPIEASSRWGFGHDNGAIMITTHR
jgi:hypothetical protein